ncbi:AMP-binding protein [Nocardia vermiculata]|uniref:Fatty acyl-AMP ligase n=1 Tax=Nocardia vermiculata TaxID=257274 RepID=A0A846XXE1_9NOCA|nr:AMP-binding protein [Nocardia vermiculata]NKY48869.1 fatty acyl-AMP ligase [Nocardia vermiculata]
MDTASGLLSAQSLGSALTELTAHHTLRDTTVDFPDGGHDGRRLTLARLDDGSSYFARGLLRAGIGPGDVVGIAAPASAAFLVAWFGIVRAGAVAAVLPITAPDRNEQAARLEHLVGASDMRAVVAADTYAAVAEELRRRCPRLSILPITQASPDHGTLPRIDADDLAAIQYTSGSTTAPRGVTLTHRNILTGLAAIASGADLTLDDVWVQWTPLYHDMGLFGLLTSLLNGCPTVSTAPRTFVRRPERFLSMLAETGGTITTGPNFGYDLMIEAAETRTEAMADLDLSRWRLAFNGGEVISPHTVARFTDAFGGRGVAPSVMYPVYGMAEATLAITFPTVGSEPETLWVDRDRLAEDGTVRRVSPGAPAATGLVRVGRPVPGMHLRIAGEFGEECAEGHLGEIQIAGEAVTAGYHRNPAATAELFEDGRLKTGDLGFLVDGELYVGGRRKEMVIVHGRNYFPTDAEYVARRVPGVYRGHAVAFADIDHDSAGGSHECLGVIVESEEPSSSHDDLATLVRKHVTTELDLAAVRVHVVPPGSLTRSTSGKWQRLAAATRLARQQNRG